jgi:hypothetical protein
MMLSPHYYCSTIFYAIVAYKHGEHVDERYIRTLTPNGVWVEDDVQFIWTRGEAMREWDARVLRCIKDFPSGYTIELSGQHHPCGTHWPIKILRIERDV